MAGANYMGGKRNAAKAKSRDVVGRAQKRFFGQKRLDVLSKGLLSSREERAGEAKNQTTKMMQINLGHAKRNLQHAVDPDAGPSNVKEKTIHIEGQNAVAKENKTARGGKRSEVLDMIDVSDPTLLRMAIDRILALPDLAGLSGAPERLTAMQTKVSATPNRADGGKELSDSLGRKQIQSETHSVQTSPTFQFSISSHAPSTRLSTDSLQPTEYHEFVELDDDPIENCSDNEAAFTAIRSWTNTSPERDAHSSTISPWESQSPQFSHTSMSDATFDHQSLSSMFTTSYYSHSDKDSLVHSHTPMTSPQPTHIGSIDVPRALPATEKSFGPDNLFDHEDPWHTIGVILGLSPLSEKPTTTSLFPKDDSELLGNSSPMKHPEGQAERHHHHEPDTGQSDSQLDHDADQEILGGDEDGEEMKHKPITCEFQVVGNVLQGPCLFSDEDEEDE